MKRCATRAPIILMNVCNWALGGIIKIAHYAGGLSASRAYFLLAITTIKVPARMPLVLKKGSEASDSRFWMKPSRSLDWRRKIKSTALFVSLGSNEHTEPGYCRLTKTAHI